MAQPATDCLNAAKYELRTFADSEALAQAVAEEWVSQTAEIRTVALSGGRIARQFYAAIVQLRPQFEHVHFFWADERGVPPNDPESNYGTARESLFKPLGIRDSQVHRIRGEDEPALAARSGSEVLRQLASNAGEHPSIDLVFLGMGEDGHVASLFPGQAERTEVYYPVIGPKPPPQRITLSYNVLAVARQVWVLVSGEGKKAALAESLSPRFATPLGRVIKGRSWTRIFCDFKPETT